MLEGLRRTAQEKFVTPAASGRISKFICMLDQLDIIFRQSNPLELLTEVIEKSGYATMLKKEDTRESKGRM